VFGAFFAESGNDGMKCQQLVKINIPGDSTAGGLKLQRHRVGGITTAIRDIEVNSVAAGRLPFLGGVAKGPTGQPFLNCRPLRFDQSR
jgi:hypothetical protein